MSVTIYHNPTCGTSRNTLALIRATGTEPQVVHYLETPPSRQELASLIQRMGIPPRDLLRQKGTPYAELGSKGDGELVSANDRAAFSAGRAGASDRHLAGAFAPLQGESMHR